MPSITKTALITGASKRIGRHIAKTLHATHNIIIHYNNSKQSAQTLHTELTNIRPNSATLIQGNLNDSLAIHDMCAHITSLDTLINNASVFYPTTIDEVSPSEFDTFMHTNVLAPLMLSQKLFPLLTASKGNIVNIVDIHALRPLKDYIIYNISKSGIYMLTQTLAKDLAPNVRVNGVSPGSILWPENDAELSEADKRKMLDKIALQRQGSPEDIANAVKFFTENDYLTGQIISVDGGRTLNQ